MSSESTFQFGDVVLARWWTPAPARGEPLPTLFALGRLLDETSSDFVRRRLLELAEALGGPAARREASGYGQGRRLEAALDRIELALLGSELAAFEIAPRVGGPGGALAWDEPAPPWDGGPPDQPIGGAHGEDGAASEEAPRVDAAAQAATLVAAAAQGTPFCEECEQGARQARHAA